jgi:hypothetical protein
MIIKSELIQTIKYPAVFAFSGINGLRGVFMVDVYYYVPEHQVDISVQSGIKLSESFDKEVLIDGVKRKCFSAFLNPKDDIAKYNSASLKCLKFEVQPKYCYVAEKYFYDAGLHNPEIMEMYTESVVPVEKYIFGSYRLPECLVTSTIVWGYVSIMNKVQDSPVLFESSEKLYINNIVEECRERHEYADDAMLYYFYCKLAEIKKFDKIENIKNGFDIFIDRESKKKYILRVPDLS